jgi:undecaprenyl-diphosphatase
LFVALAATIGLSRVCVGDHYPSDVLGGAVIGALVGLAVIVALRLLRRRFPRCLDLSG